MMPIRTPRKEISLFVSESPFNCEYEHIECSYEPIWALLVRSRVDRWQASGSGARARWTGTVRQELAGSVMTEPMRGSRSLLSARITAVCLATVLFGSACSGAAASTKTTKAPAKVKKAAKKPTTKKPRSTTTIKRVTTTKPATTTVSAPTTPKLSAAAEAVLVGYEQYLVAVVAVSRQPEQAEQLLPKGMTGDALDRMLEIARFNVAEGQFWDGTRADIKSGPKVQSVGDTRAVLKDCRSIGGVVRKRTTNEIVTGTTEPDVDDLIVDLVRIDGKWVVTRTDRTNKVEGRSTCAVASSP
jgi:hypothetical protein